MGDSSGGFFKAAIAIGVLAAGLGVGYYFGLYLPGRDQARSTAVAECLKRAADLYDKDWEDGCQSMKLGKSCKLPRLLATQIEDRHHQFADMCYRQFP